MCSSINFLHMYIAYIIFFINEFSTIKKIILVAKGEQIPNAVAVANIITENMLKGNSKIDDVLVDSEINDENLMLSNIKITLLKN